jgi:hypothetical protein
MESA